MILGAMRRHELSDEQWQKIVERLPRRPGRRAVLGDRNFINAVLWLMKTGSPWRDLPERYGSWKTIYNRFANWAKRGHWQQLFRALQVQVDESASLLDASIVRAHQDACGAKGGSRATHSVARAVGSRPSSTRWSMRADSRSTSS
jgi:transposase